LRFWQLDRREQEVFLELWRSRDNEPVTANDHASTVEDEFVLAAHLVDVGDGTPRSLRALGDHRGALIESTTVER